MSKKKGIKAENFDHMVDENEDLSDYLDTDNATKNVQVTIPIWMIKELDLFSNHLSIPRQALIKIWLSDRLKIEIDAVRKLKKTK